MTGTNSQADSLVVCSVIFLITYLVRSRESTRLHESLRVLHANMDRQARHLTAFDQYLTSSLGGSPRVP